ncbi:MAG: glycosyltransferase, partial [Firmicutes bacterium]|nr:glycosyltransferase [Bacillota bacterium]
GSRDGSGAICDRYAQQDTRFHVIHQVNQGVSAARNAGIAAAGGQYVLFLDSDDLWDSKLLECIDGFVSRQPDMIRFGCHRFTEKGIKETCLPAFASDGETGSVHFDRHQDLGVMPIVDCWSAAFRRFFLLEQALHFPLNFSYGEDFYFTIQCMKQAQFVTAVCQPLYQYRENELSVTHTLTVKHIREVLAAAAAVYRRYPCNLLADYYCMVIWTIAELKREDAMLLTEQLQKNRDILRHISGRKARLAYGFYRLFGWYGGAKLLRGLSDIRTRIMG